MKKTLFVFVLLCIFSCACAESIDLSGLSFADLSFLRDKCQLEMMKRDEWQEVTVPVGVWEVGKDIPEGHWNITASKESNYGWAHIVYTDMLDESGKKSSYDSNIYYAENIKHEDSTADVEAINIDIDLKAGTYLIIDYGAAVFTPYTGKPNLGFK